MKVFNKIWIAKYKNVCSICELAKDIGSSSKEVEEVIKELEQTGKDKIYNNIPDEEWEKLENKTEDYVLKKYANKKSDEEIFKELIKIFKTERKKVEFEIFDSLKWELKGIKDKIIKNEEWKQIDNFHYSLSNYGRVRNDLTENIKNPRYHNWILQVDIYENGKRYTLNIKRAVANYFIREVKKDEKVISIDGDIRNNYYQNLKIVKK